MLIEETGREGIPLSGIQISSPPFLKTMQGPIKPRYRLFTISYFHITSFLCSFCTVDLHLAY